jgi:hypothetical protein
MGDDLSEAKRLVERLTPRERKEFYHWFQPFFTSGQMDELMALHGEIDLLLEEELTPETARIIRRKLLKSANLQLGIPYKKEEDKWEKKTRLISEQLAAALREMQAEEKEFWELYEDFIKKLKERPDLCSRVIGLLDVGQSKQKKS